MAKVATKKEPVKKTVKKSTSNRLNKMLMRVYGTTKVSKADIEAACLKKYGRKEYPK